MGDQRHDVPMCDTVASQLVGHQTKRLLSLILQESPKESPPRARNTLTAAVTKTSSGNLSELDLVVTLAAERSRGRTSRTTAGRFVRDDDSSFGKQILDIPEAHEVFVEKHTAWLMLSGGKRCLSRPFHKYANVFLLYSAAEYGTVLYAGWHHNRCRVRAPTGLFCRPPKNRR